MYVNSPSPLNSGTSSMTSEGSGEARLTLLIYIHIHKHIHIHIHSTDFFGGAVDSYLLNPCVYDIYCVYYLLYIHIHSTNFFGGTVYSFSGSEDSEAKMRSRKSRGMQAKVRTDYTVTPSPNLSRDSAKLLDVRWESRGVPSIVGSGGNGGMRRERRVSRRGRYEGWGGVRGGMGAADALTEAQVNTGLTPKSTR